MLPVLAVESVLPLLGGDESWLHPAPAEAKRPRFAPGFYEPYTHGLNAALYEALESAKKFRVAI